MGLVDTHTHLYDNKYNSDRANVINGFDENNIDFVVTCGDSIKSSKKAMKLSEDYDKIFFAAGIHPHNAKEYSDKSNDELIQILSHNKAVAVGEIGLDYHYDFSPRDIQKECMKAQINIAKKLKKPIVFHIREAYGDFLPMIRKKEIPQNSVMHCFGGSMESAIECLDNGMMISFTGVITFKNASKIREIAKFVPLENIMIETDCPYMAPVPYRGKRNEPKYVIEVAKAISDIKQINIEEVIEITKQNAINFFGINK